MLFSVFLSQSPDSDFPFSESSRLGGGQERLSGDDKRVPWSSCVAVVAGSRVSREVRGKREFPGLSGRREVERSPAQLPQVEWSGDVKVCACCFDLYLCPELSNSEHLLRVQEAVWISHTGLGVAEVLCCLDRAPSLGGLSLSLSLLTYICLCEECPSGHPSTASRVAES